MVCRASLAAALLVAGCAPRVILSDEGASGTSEDSDTDTAASSDGSSGDSSPVTTLPPMTTIGPMSTSGPSTDTFGSEGGFESSGFFGSSGDLPPALCWSSTALFEAPEESRLFVIDQDGDGLAELWLSFFKGGGPGGGAELFWFDPSGLPNSAGFFSGFLTGLYDMNGDGVGDGVGFSFGGGGPPSLGYIVASPFSIEGPFTPTPFGFDDGFEGFTEITGDGLTDFFRNTEGIVELFAGDGIGGFNPIAALPTSLTGDVAPRLVKQDSELVAVAQSGYFDELDSCSPHGFELMRNNKTGLEPLGIGGEANGFVPNQLIGAESFGAFTNVYARACSGKGGVTVQVHRFEGNALSTVDNYDASSFAAFGDFDGNGLDDIALGSPSLDTVSIYNGSAVGTFTQGLVDEVPFGEPVPSRVFIVDMDADGRDEIIVGTRDGGSEIAYQRLDLEPC